MWNMTKNEVPRHHIEADAIEQLEKAVTDIMDEGPNISDVEVALSTLFGHSYANTTVAIRFIDALSNERYDSATRYHAAEQALKIIKRQFGQCL